MLKINQYTLEEVLEDYDFKSLISEVKDHVINFSNYLESINNDMKINFISVPIKDLYTVLKIQFATYKNVLTLTYYRDNLTSCDIIIDIEYCFHNEASRIESEISYLKLNFDDKLPENIVQQIKNSTKNNRENRLQLFQKKILELYTLGDMIIDQDTVETTKKELLNFKYNFIDLYITYQCIVVIVYNYIDSNILYTCNMVIKNDKSFSEIVDFKFID